MGRICLGAKAVCLYNGELIGRACKINFVEVFLRHVFAILTYVQSCYKMKGPTVTARAQRRWLLMHICTKQSLCSLPLLNSANKHVQQPGMENSLNKHWRPRQDRDSWTGNYYNIIFLSSHSETGWNVTTEISQVQAAELHVLQTFTWALEDRRLFSWRCFSFGDWLAEL